MVIYPHTCYGSSGLHLLQCLIIINSIQPKEVTEHFYSAEKIVWVPEPLKLWLLRIHSTFFPRNEPAGTSPLLQWDCFGTHISSGISNSSLLTDQVLCTHEHLGIKNMHPCKCCSSEQPMQSWAPHVPQAVWWREGLQAQLSLHFKFTLCCYR